MPDTTTDPLSAYLADVREHLRSAECVRCEATPLLLAAVEAALKVAGELCKDTPCSSALDEDRMWGRQEHGRQIIQAIRSELTSGEGGKGR